MASLSIIGLLFPFILLAQHIRLILDYFSLCKFQWDRIRVKIQNFGTFIKGDGQKKLSGDSGSVVDPYSFFTDPDPDPEFAVGDQYGSGSGFRIRIQYGSRALMTKN